MLRTLKKTNKVLEETSKTLKDVKRRISFITILGSITLGLSIGCNMLTFYEKFKGGIK